MNWIAIVVGIILLIPIGIFIIRRLAGILALLLGVVGILCLVSKMYIAGVILFLVAFLLTKLTPPQDPDDDYL